MINRDMVQATLLTYDQTLDEYGQPRMNEPSERPVEVTKPKLYQHREVEDIRFQDVTHFSFSYNKTVSDANELVVDGISYLIKFVNPEGRVTQLFLIKK